MYDFYRVSIQIADHGPEIVRANVRPLAWGPDRDCATFYRQLVKLDDLILAIRTQRDMGTRAYNCFRSLNRIEKECPLPARTKRGFLWRTMLKLVTERSKAVGIELNRRLKLLATQ